MKTEVQKEHEWLQSLVGDWIYESECVMGPGKPPEIFKGTESARSIGGLWILCEGRGEMPGGDMAVMLMTLGYDPQKQQYIGTWVGSMMTHLWIYSGSLDNKEKILTLNTEGPSFSGDGKLVKYKDVIELKSNNERILTSHMLDDEEKWQLFMTANYQRKL